MTPMAYYNQEKKKIVMPSEVFFKIRHGGGNMDNHGLFFRDGYEKPPVYKCNGEYIEVELID